MPKAKKRKPDLRAIRPTKTYLLSELAETVKRDEATIRRWHREGLPALDGGRPLLFDGATVKEWLKEKWARRKAPCGPDQAYCFTCKSPRRFRPGSDTVRRQTAKSSMRTGECAVCGKAMNTVEAACNAKTIVSSDAHASDKCDA